ncbi:hypothetical protein [uncultured Roseobacter sp.]|uniref:hypothetical protein n=1 Tax=uncultured Roseobacter sp. TaxID=114847 RepID=UPI002639787D|nr:hypothetical protein [uncultured Roseobacter sp.]
MTHHITRSQPSKAVRDQQSRDWSWVFLAMALIAFAAVAGMVAVEAMTIHNFHALQGCGAC